MVAATVAAGAVVTRDVPDFALVVGVDRVGQAEELREVVTSGPDLNKDGVVRWRCVDLKRVLEDRFAVDLSEVSLGRVLKQLGFSHISARPQHPAQDAQAIATFKKTFPPLSPRR